MMQSSAITRKKPGLGQRFDNWLLDRVRLRRGTAQLPLKFEYRHIYVMPTRFGFWFGLLLALITLGGLNFNNNMTLMLGFLLAAIAQLTTLLAYRNQAGITVDAIRARPVFAEESACFKVLLRNPELQVTQVALQCGFENLSHFSRAFKTRFGSSPAQFRKEPSGID